MNRWLSLDYYLQRLGGWYVLLIVGIAQIPTFIGALLGNLYVRHNAGFDPKALVEISRYTPFLILATNLLLLALAWYLTPKARLRLTDWGALTAKAFSVEKGEVTVQSDLLGEFKLPRSAVREIVFAAAEKPSAEKKRAP